MRPGYFNLSVNTEPTLIDFCVFTSPTLCGSPQRSIIPYSIELKLAEAVDGSQDVRKLQFVYEGPRNATVAKTIDPVEVTAVPVAAPEVLSVQLTFVKDKVLKVRRGRRAGFYVQAKCEYNSITGIDVPTYKEVLCVAKLWAFGKTMNESLKGRIVKIVEDALKDLGIKLPPSQRLLLVTQVWVDLTTGKGVEDHANTHLHESRDEYRTKSSGGDLSDTWWQTFSGKALSVLSLGMIAAPTAAGLPRE